MLHTTKTTAQPWAKEQCSGALPGEIRGVGRFVDRESQRIWKPIQKCQEPPEYQRPVTAAEEPRVYALEK